MNWRYWLLRFECSWHQHQLTKLLAVRTGGDTAELLLACRCGQRVEDAEDA